MHSLTIWFGPAATSITLLFKTFESADAASREAAVDTDGPLLVGDDFGQAVNIARHAISGILLEDLNLSKEALVERGLHTARVQAEANKRGMEDPTIRASIRAQQGGPAVYNPMGGRA